MMFTTTSECQKRVENTGKVTRIAGAQWKWPRVASAPLSPLPLSRHINHTISTHHIKEVSSWFGYQALPQHCQNLYIFLSACAKGKKWPVSLAACPEVISLSWINWESKACICKEFHLQATMSLQPPLPMSAPKASNSHSISSDTSQELDETVSRVWMKKSKMVKTKMEEIPKRKKFNKQPLFLLAPP